MAPVFTAIAGRENPGPAAAARGTGQAGIKIFKYWSLLISSMGSIGLDAWNLDISLCERGEGEQWSYDWEHSQSTILTMVPDEELF